MQMFSDQLRKFMAGQYGAYAAWVDEDKHVQLQTAMPAEGSVFDYAFNVTSAQWKGRASASKPQGQPLKP